MKLLFLLSTLFTAFSTYAANSPIIWNASCVGTQAYNLGNNLCLTDNGTGPYLPLSGGTLTGALNGTSANFSGNVTVNTLTTEGSVVYSSDAFSSLIITPSGTDIAIGNGINAPDGSGGVAVGSYSIGYSDGVAVGSYSSGSNYGAAVGVFANGSNYGAALGSYSSGSNYGAAVGSFSNGSYSGAAVGNSSNGSGGGAAVGDGANTSGINGAVAIGGDVNSVYTATVPGGFTLPTVQLGQGTAVLDGALNFGTGATVYPVMNSTGGLFGYSASSLDNGAITTDGSGGFSFQGSGNISGTATIQNIIIKSTGSYGWIQNVNDTSGSGFFIGAPGLGLGDPILSAEDYTNGGTLDVGSNFSYGGYNGGTIRMNSTGVRIWDGGDVHYLNISGGTVNTDQVTVDDGSGNASFNNTTVTAIKNSATQTIVSCSLGGSITLSQPEQGSSYKKIVAYANSCHGTASYSFPTTFSHVPSIVTLATGGISAAYVTILATNTLTVNAVSTTSGNLIIEGY